jgi:hypothetical protein
MASTVAAADQQQYQRRARALPQPSIPLNEVGLKALAPITKALTQKASPAKSAPILQAVSSLLQHVAPLRMFSDFSPAHSPPEAPVLLTEAQVTADSVKNATSYSVFNAFDPKHADSLANPSAAPAAGSSASGWCSKSRPSNNKSSITVVLSRTEQLTGIYLELPSEAGMKPELIGLEALHAPEENSNNAAEMSASEIQAHLRKPNLKWHPLGVLSGQMLEEGGKRVPLTAHNIIALRISFKGYAKANNDRYHGLSRCVLYKASDRIKPGVGGHALYSDSAAVLHTLDSWFRSVGVNSSGSANNAPASDAQDASVLSLAGLSLATGSLSSTLSLVEVLLGYQRTLPAPLARSLRSYLYSLDSLFDSMAVRTSPSSGKSAVKINPDRTAEARWSDKSSNVTLSEGDTRARSSSSPEYCALNLGISKGKMVWEMTIQEDSRDGECQCFGICKKPVTSYSYDSSSCNMWLWRAYNGQL